MNLEGTYICQTCNKIIHSPQQGWIQWQDNDELQYYGFKIVHHKSYSPLKYKRANGCYLYKNDAKLNDLPLEYFYGPNGIEFLVHMMGRKSKNGKTKFLNPSERSELFMRLYNLPLIEAIS